MNRARYYEYFLLNEIEDSEEVLYNECNNRDDTEIPIEVDLSQVLGKDFRIWKNVECKTKEVGYNGY